MSAPPASSYVVVVTGSAGSGKSTFSHFLKDLGAAVVDADQLARRAVEPGTAALAELGRVFGPQIINIDGTLNRQRLASLVFDDPARRGVLESIVHPIVARLAGEEFARVRQEGAPLIVYDVPLFFEAGLDRLPWRKVITVTARREACVERGAGRGCSAAEFQKRLDSQMPDEEKAQRADIVVENNGSLSELCAKAAEVFRQVVDA